MVSRSHQTSSCLSQRPHTPGKARPERWRAFFLLYLETLGFFDPDLIVHIIDHYIASTKFSGQ